MQRQRERMPNHLRGRHLPSHIRYIDGQFTNKRGQALSYCALFPPSSARLRGIMLFLHGLGDHCRRYFHVYEQVCAGGFGVLAYDMISHGLSDNCMHNVRTHARKFTYFVEDTNEFISVAKQEVYQLMLDDQEHDFQPPLVLCGVSNGTLVGLHTVLSEQHEFAALILVAPAFAIKWSKTLKIASLLSKPLSLLIPKVQVVPPMDPHLVCRDPGHIEDYANDPLAVFAPITARMAEQLIAAMVALEKERRIEDGQSSIGRLPLLTMIGSDDRVASVSMAKQFFKRMANKDKEFKEIEGAYHALLDDPEQDDFVGYIVVWLKKRFPCRRTAGSSHTKK